MRLCSLVNHGTYQLVLGKFIRSSNRIEPVGIGVIRLDYQTRTVAFPFLLTYSGYGISPMLSFRFLRFRVFDTQSAFNGLLPFIAPSLNLFKVTCKLVL